MHEILNLVCIAPDTRRYLDPDFIRKTFSIEEKDGLRAIGFKLMYGQATSVELEEDYFGPLADNENIRKINKWLIDNNLSKHAFEHLWQQINNDKEIRIIHLVRKNKLHAYVSLQLAIREENWINKKYYSIKDGLIINKNDLESWFKKGEEFYQFYKDFFKHHNLLEIHYDDLSQNYSQTLKRVFLFLRLHSKGWYTPAITKQNTYKISEIIQNFKEIREYFKNTRWSNYFNE